MSMAWQARRGFVMPGTGIARPHYRQIELSHASHLTNRESLSAASFMPPVSPASATAANRDYRDNAFFARSCRYPGYAEQERAIAA